MSNMETLEFSALGARLRLAAGDDPESLREVIRFVQERIGQISENAPNAQPLQIALLTALDITEQLIKEREQERTECHEAVDRVRLLLQSIDERSSPSEFESE